MVSYLGILWYSILSKIISSFWGIIFHIGNVDLRPLTGPQGITPIVSRVIIPVISSY